MGRVQVMNKIGDILDLHCKKCDKKTSQESIHACSKCPHGILLLELGESLDEITTKAREDKKMAESEKLKALTIEQYNKLSETMTDNKLAKHLDTTIHYLRKWKQERGLVEKRKDVANTTHTSRISHSALDTIEQVKRYAEEVKTLREENKRLTTELAESFVARDRYENEAVEEIMRLHNRIELLEQQLSEKQRYEQVDIKLPKDLPDAVQIILSGGTVDLVDIELRKTVIPTIRRMGLWLDIKHYVPARLAKTAPEGVVAK